MMLFRRACLTALLALTFAACAAAQAARDGAGAARGGGGVTAERRRDIARLLAAMNVIEQEKKSIDVAIESYKRSAPQVPAQLWQEMRKELSAEFTDDVIIDTYVPIYARHFSAADVKSLLAFYGSPVGKKFVVEMPAVQAEAYIVGFRHGQQIGLKLREKLKAKGYDLGISE